MIYFVVFLFLVLGNNHGIVWAQERRPIPPQLPDGPLDFDASENVRFRVRVVTRGLSHPWALAFLPNGDILVTERAGRVRIVRKGVLDPIPVATVDVATTFTLSGLMDIVLHPRFGENNLVYLTYNKAAPIAAGW
jgi:glucose/arabinose dehydrogenase